MPDGAAWQPACRASRCRRSPTRSAAARRISSPRSARRSARRITKWTGRSTARSRPRDMATRGSARGFSTAPARRTGSSTAGRPRAISSPPPAFPTIRSTSPASAPRPIPNYSARTAATVDRPGASRRRFAPVNDEAKRRVMRTVLVALFIAFLTTFSAAFFTTATLPAQAGAPIEAELEKGRQLLQQHEYFAALQQYQRANRLAGGASAEAFLGMAL